VIAVRDVVGRDRLVDGDEHGWRRAQLHHGEVAVLAGRRADLDAREVQRGHGPREHAAVELRADLDQVDRDGHFLIVRKPAGGGEQPEELTLRTGQCPCLRERQVVGQRDLRRRRARIECRVVRRHVPAGVVPDPGLARGQREDRERSGGDTSKQHWLPPHRGDVGAG